MNIKAYLDSLNLSDGATSRADCPICGGENTFTVINDSGSILYNCYKLGCKARGAVHVGLSAADIKRRLDKAAKGKAKEEIPTMVIPEYVNTQPSHDNVLLNDFIYKWHLQGVALMYDVKDRRAVFPIYHKGRIVDAVGRALDGKKPKWLRYSGNAHYYKAYRGDDMKVAVVVEDVISAHTVSSLLPSVTGFAILGTSLTSDHMAALGEYDRVVIALDRDAASKTIQFKREVDAWTGVKTDALLLKDDIKYRIDKDIEALKELLQ
jgi:hypothetical protein